MRHLLAENKIVLAGEIVLFVWYVSKIVLTNRKVTFFISEILDASFDSEDRRRRE